MGKEKSMRGEADKKKENVDRERCVQGWKGNNNRGKKEGRF